MKKIFLLLSVLASSLCMNAQNIKYVEAVGEEYIFEEPMSDEWRKVDSLVVTGTLSVTNFRKILRMAEFFNLTGLNLENCNLENDSLPDMITILANSSAPSLEKPRGRMYDFIMTEERFGRINIKYITFPKTMKKTGEMFCCNFEVLDIPEYLSVVKSWTIIHPDYLKGLVLHVMSPSEMGAFHFQDIPESAVLYVPQGAKSAFEADETWSTAFKTIKEYDVAGIDNAVTIPGIKSDRIYTLDGRYVGTDINALAKGMYIVNGKKILK